MAAKRAQIINCLYELFQGVLCNDFGHDGSGIVQCSQDLQTRPNMLARGIRHCSSRDEGIDHEIKFVY